MVFHNHALSSSKAVPRYLDLGWYAEHQGIAFTHSSNLVQALDTASRLPDWPKKFAESAAISARMRASLREMGFQLVASEHDATPGVVSIALPEHQNSAQLGARLQRAGYLLSYNSDYLRKRNWIQICLMGEFSPEKLDSLLAWLNKHAAPTRNSASVPMTVAN
jgi:aspartate aminotransferase-like enzyme